MNKINKLSILGGIRSLGGSILWPFVGFALYHVYRVSFTYISLFYLIQGIVNVSAYILGGYLTDYLGRVKAMLITSILSSLSLLLAFLINSPLYVITFVLIQTLFDSIYNVANTSLVGDLSKGFKTLIKSFSRVRVGINAGWSAGPVIGGILFSSLGFRYIMLFGSIISLFSTFFLFGFEDIKGKIEVSFRLTKDLIKFLIPTFFTFMIMEQL